MRTGKLVCIFASVTLAASSLLAQAQVLRKSPEFSIIKPPNEEEILLSSYKGKVVVLEFLFVGSPHCLQLAGMLNTLQGDLGPRGFQAVAIAFGPHSDASMIGHVATRLGLNYPMGHSTTDKVDAYLGRTGDDKFKIPQMIVIDRKGFIRAATDKGDPSLEHEAWLRTYLDTLLREPVPSSASGQPPASAKAKTNR